VPYKLDPHEHEWLRAEVGDEVDKHEYRHGEGCSQCNGTGYQGRTGVYEMLEMTQAVTEAANQEDSNTFVRIAREQIGTNTLRNHAAHLVMSGRTTAEEAMKISNAFEE
jgi:MSHA biogenesis protein MshE